MNAPLQSEVLETEQSSAIPTIIIAIIFVVLVVIVPMVNPGFASIFAGLTAPATNFVTGMGDLADQLIDKGLMVLTTGLVSFPLTMAIVAALKKLPFVGNFKSNVLALVVALLLNAVLLSIQGVWPDLDLANLQNIALAGVTILVGTGGTQMAASALHDKLLPTSFPLAHQVGEHRASG